MARNRVIYQSEALFVGPKAGGVAAVHKELHRVQSISHDMSATRTDIFEFGRLAALDKVMIEAPTVSLDFSYLLTNGENENNIGLVVERQTAGYTSDGNRMGRSALPNALSGIVANPGGAADEKNYYVVTIPEGKDADGAAVFADTSYWNPQSVVGFGNGVLSNYSINGAVGDFASASVSIEAFNLSFISGQTPADTDAWLSGSVIPSVRKGSDTLAAGGFVIPTSSTGTQNVFAIRPGDILLDFDSSNTASQHDGTLGVGGAILPGGSDPDAGTAEGATDPEPMHIQNFSIDMPLARTALTRLGSTFPYYRAIDFPLNVTMNCSALLADVSTGSLVDIMCNDQKRDINVALRNPCNSSQTGDAGGDIQSNFRLKNAQLVSQNFSASIGDNKTVDLSFEATLGGPRDKKNGLFISGSVNDGNI